MLANIIKTAMLGGTVALAGFCSSLQAQSPTITAYTEVHAKTGVLVSPDKKQSWQTVDLNVVPTGVGPLLGWRQWGGRFLATSLVHYDGSQGTASGVASGTVSDILGYDPANTYVGTDSDFLITYKDAKTGVTVKDTRNFVYTFDSLAFTVPADANPKILRLWTGAYACDGEMGADLLSSTGDVLISFSKTMVCPLTGTSPSDRFYGYWRFRFQGTAPGQTLRMRWRSVHRTENSANVTLQAAVLTAASAAPTR